MRLITWNMQGGNASTEVKWQTGVMPFIRSVGTGGADADIVCLQECGRVPASAEHQETVGEVDCYNWGNYLLLFYGWDEGGHRCNLAIVLKEKNWSDLEDKYVYPKIAPWRPLLCIELEGVTYMSIHAIGGTGKDVQELLDHVHNLKGEENWVVAGDFNREPGAISDGPWVVCPPNKDTHYTAETGKGRKIDFAVRAQNDPLVDGSVLDNLHLSDHYPVMYDF